MGDRARYEHKTVIVLRGTERLTTHKWEKRGWELHGETPSTMRTELDFRRAKTAATRRTVAVVVLVAVLAAAITVGALTETDDETTRADNPTSSNSEARAANMGEFIAAYDAGDLQTYAQGHNADPIEFDAQVTGVGPDTLKSGGFLNLSAQVDGRTQGPPLKLVWNGFDQIPFPDDLERGQRVRVRANIDRYFSDEEVWLAPTSSDSYVQVLSSN